MLQDPTPHWSVSVVVAGQATQESGQSIKVEILMQHRREEQLTAFIKSAVDEKADMAARMAKLESERASARRGAGEGTGAGSHEGWRGGVQAAERVHAGG